MIPTLWYENDAGDRWVPDMTRDPSPPPEGFRYQHSRFPRTLRHSILLCEEGRSRQLAAGESSWPIDVALAMSRPTLRERFWQVVRCGRLQPRVQLDQAILYAAVSCEGCLNVLAYEHGTADGYRRGSTKHRRSKTECELCKPRNATLSNGESKGNG